jgi:hypothetical protein
LPRRGAHIDLRARPARNESQFLGHRELHYLRNLFRRFRADRR